MPDPLTIRRATPEDRHAMIELCRASLGWKRDDPNEEVDNATHPDWQGRGIFSRLTLGALDELAEAGLDVVFNTPNDQSRPGYLKMGWALADTAATQRLLDRLGAAARRRPGRRADRVPGAAAVPPPN